MTWQTYHLCFSFLWRRRRRRYYPLRLKLGSIFVSLVRRSSKLEIPRRQSVLLQKLAVVEFWMILIIVDNKSGWSTATCWLLWKFLGTLVASSLFAHSFSIPSLSCFFLRLQVDSRVSLKKYTTLIVLILAYYNFRESSYLKNFVCIVLQILAFC